MNVRSPLTFVIALASIVGSVVVAQGTTHAIDPGPTPKPVSCGENDLPEPGLQGRVSREDVDSGRAALGYTCNTTAVGSFGYTGLPGGSGGYRTYRYVDQAGNECGYYDSTLLLPTNVPTQRENLPGVFVLDMSDPSNPRRTANLITPAMLTPHESLSLNETRGLLAAAMGNPLTSAGIVDIYDLTQDCRHPTLLSSTPLGILGHEGTFSPDGNTYWVTSTQGNHITALDIRDPALPDILWRSRAYRPHGLNISDDGDRLYLADTTSGRSGLTILDVSGIQDRVLSPQVEEVAHLTWDTVSIPQTNLPITIGGHPYLVEIDEFARGLSQGSTAHPVGAARIIDIADERNPAVVSNLRLEVNMPEHYETTLDDPGAGFFLQGYTGHYCAVPRRDDPGIVACSFILSGMRVFDIRDPHAPKEIAYFNAPLSPTHEAGTEGGSYAMSAPAFDPDDEHIWYTDGNSGFHAFELTNGVWPG